MLVQPSNKRKNIQINQNLNKMKHRYVGGEELELVFKSLPDG